MEPRGQKCRRQSSLMERKKKTIDFDAIMKTAAPLGFTSDILIQDIFCRRLNRSSDNNDDGQPASNSERIKTSWRAVVSRR